MKHDLISLVNATRKFSDKNLVMFMDYLINCHIRGNCTLSDIAKKHGVSRQFLHQVKDRVLINQVEFYQRR